MPTRLVATPTDREAVKEKPTSEVPTSEKPTSVFAERKDAAAKLIRRITAAKSMQLQIRKHGTMLYHQEQARRLSGDDDDA